MATQANLSSVGRKVIQKLVVPIAIAAASGNQVVINASALSTTSGRWAMRSYSIRTDTDTTIIWKSATSDEVIPSRKLLAGLPDEMAAKGDDEYIAICDANENLTLVVGSASTIGGVAVICEVI